MCCARSVKRRFSSLISASSHPLPQTPFRGKKGEEGKKGKWKKGKLKSGPDRLCQKRPFQFSSSGGAQPSARLSEEICLLEGSQGPLRGSLRGLCGVGSAGFSNGSDSIHMSGGANYLPKFLPISFFRRASRFIGVSRHLALQ